MKNLKALVEQRADFQEELNSIVNTADTEERAMTEEEVKKFDEIETKIKALDGTIEREERARTMEIKNGAQQQDHDIEERAGSEILTAFVRGEEVRAGEMSTTTNGNIIPSDFSTDIIRKVTELSGIYNEVAKIQSTGTYKQIVEKNKMTAGWTAELAEVTAASSTFDIVEIGHHKLGSLAKISLELINQANFPIASEVQQQMVDAFVQKVEQGVIKGTGIGQPTGLMSGGTAFALASVTAITAEEVVKIYHALKAPYLANAKWLVSRATLCAIRLLKDSTGKFLFHEAELTSGYVGYILGKPVLISEEMADYQIMFGDFAKAYKANVNPQMTIQLLNEVYASQGAKGILGFLFIDGKPVNNEAYVVAKSA